MVRTIPLGFVKAFQCIYMANSIYLHMQANKGMTRQPAISCFVGGSHAYSLDARCIHRGNRRTSTWQRLRGKQG